MNEHTPQAGPALDKLSPDRPSSALAALPGVDRLMTVDPALDLVAIHGRTCVLNAVRTVLDTCRDILTSNPDRAIAEEDIYQRIDRQVADDLAHSLKPVINLTGTVIHTNLGRSPLPESAIDAMAAAARQPVNLEYDLVAGKRGDRDSHLEDRICRLTGAEAATVVNNNAAAVLLVLNSLANRRGVPVSRGELVEIGGSFRLPDIMRRAGARLIEVGTTNRTHLKDFESVMADRPALVLKAHTSNYAVVGFTASVAEQALAELCHSHGIPFCIDLGSGTVVDLQKFGLPHEPTVQEAFSNGADLVTFSGDKLLGGPQAGIVAGRRDLVERIKRNPMRRALRLDKVTIAALDAVLTLYQTPERLAETVPSLRNLARPVPEIEETAKAVATALASAAPSSVRVETAPCFSQIGSGALPTEALPSMAVRLTVEGGKKASGSRLRALSAAFRALPVPVIGRIGEGAFWLDMRCLDDPDSLLEQLVRLDWSEAT